MMNLTETLPKLVQEKDYSDVESWPKVHIWANGTVIVEEADHVLIWDDIRSMWRRYEWAAIQEFPKQHTVLKGIDAIKYILDRIGG
jgi:hypothetical protein